MVNNSVVWHSGTLTISQTWSASQVQAIDGDVIVPAGSHSHHRSGNGRQGACRVRRSSSQSGGTLIATGTTGRPVTFTTFDDYSIGGDTDFNQGISLPAPGEWNGIGVLRPEEPSPPTPIPSSATRRPTLTGTLQASTTLYGTQVYTVSGTWWSRPV